MKKTYKIDVDCANCANKMEEAAKHSRCRGCYRKLYDAQMIVEFEDGQDPKSVMQNVLKTAKS